MSKNLALAAPTMMLVAISGQAFAGTAAPKVRYSKATGRPNLQIAFNAFDPAMATQTAVIMADRNRTIDV
jgi:hypothetical protein